MDNESGLTVLYDVWTLSNVTGRAIAQALGPTGLSPVDFALYSLLRTSGPQPPSVLARLSHSPATSLTQQVRRAIERGDVRRRPHPTDGRSYSVELTAKGVRAHASAERRFGALISALRTRLTTPESEMRTAMAELVDALESCLDAPLGHDPG